MNEWGYAQVGKSVSAITAIAFPPYACCGVPETAWSPGYLLTCELFLNGRYLAIAGAPEGNVEYQWFPHRVIRKQTAERLEFTTCMFLPNQAAGRRTVDRDQELEWIASSFHARF
jgi:hypothetical protein